MIQMALSDLVMLLKLGVLSVKVENNQCQFFSIYHQEEFG